MIKLRSSDPDGDYRLSDGQVVPVENEEIDLVFTSFVLQEYPSKEQILFSLKEFSRVLVDSGIGLILHSSRHDHQNDWVSFSCNFPENRNAKSGDKVYWQIQGADSRHHDYLWTEEDMKELFTKAKFELLEIHRPLATGDEPYKWKVETTLSCWDLFVIQKLS